MLHYLYLVFSAFSDRFYPQRSYPESSILSALHLDCRYRPLWFLYLFINPRMGRRKRPFRRSSIRELLQLNAKFSEQVFAFGRMKNFYRYNIDRMSLCLPGGCHTRQNNGISASVRHFVRSHPAPSPSNVESDDRHKLAHKCGFIVPSYFFYCRYANKC